MKALYELKEKFEMELEELARKGELGAGDLELAHKLTDTIKNIDKICALEEDGGYSRAGDWEADMRGTYGRGSSYRGRKRDSMGRYSRDGRMDGYSHHNARESMMELAREMMENTSSEREREAIRRFMTELERD
jgi:hypothetical protein